MTTKRNFIYSAFWSVGVQILSMIIVLLSNILLARKLSPEEIGSLGIILPFIGIANIFSDGGLSGALVRMKEVEKKDFATVFIFNIVISLILSLIFISISSFVADFYKQPVLKWLLIVSTSIIIISAFQIVQNAKLVIAMRFKEKSLSMFFSTLLGVLVGLYLAYVQELGVWSLIAIPITTNIFLVLFYAYFAGFFISFKFSKSSFKNLYAFGVNTTFASVLNVVMSNIYQLVLGRSFSLAQVGFFYQAKKLNDVPTALVNNLSQGVIYSGLAKVYGDDEKIYKAYTSLMKFFTTAIGFLSAFVFVFAPFIIEFLFKDKWMGSVFYLQFLSIAGFFYCQELMNKVIFKLYDKTNTLLKLEVVKNIIQIIGVGIGIYLKSIEILIYLYVLTAIISYVLNYYATKSILNVSSRYEQILMVKVSLVSLFTVFLINYLKTIITFTFVQIFIFFVLYLGCVFLAKIITIKDAKEVFSMIFNKKIT